MDLTQKKCVPCEGGVPPYTSEEIAARVADIGSEWHVVDGKKLRRNFTFADFNAAMVFVNAVAKLAEKEGHHPDLAIAYNKVSCELWTHAIGGLSINDFVMAAKIEKL